MSPTLNRDGIIVLDVCVKTRRPKTLAVARGVSAIGLGTRDQPEEEFAIIGFHNGEGGGDLKISVGGLVWLPCNGRVGVLEGG